MTAHRIANTDTVFEAMTRGNTTRDAIVRETGLEPHRVQAALQNLVYRKRIALADKQRRGNAPQSAYVITSEPIAPRPYSERKAEHRISFPAPTYTEWRPYPFTDVAVLERAAL